MPDQPPRRRSLHPYATRLSREHRIAARVGKKGREAPPARHVRGAGRGARVRRTLAATVALVALGSGGWAVARTVMGNDGTAPGASAVSAPAPPASDAAGAGTSSTTGGSASRSPSGSGSATSSAEAAVPQKGTETFTVLKVPGKDSSRSGRTVHYTVEVEGGLTGVNAARFARTVRSVLTGPRGWESVDKVHFVNVSPKQEHKGADVDIRVSLTSPDSTDKLCAPMQTNGQTSCWNGERAVINVRRWLLGADSYRNDLEHYRIYLINHEVGHGLGHEHVPCPGPGERAPVMLQQTLSLQGCTAWPYPKGA